MDLETVEKLLTTTRSVRKRLMFDKPVEREIILKCIEMAIQAPTGSNRQSWAFVVVTDADKRATIADYYRKSFERYSGGIKSGMEGNNPVADSAAYLAENLHQVPAFIIPCYKGRVENADAGTQAGFYGSIIPAAWSLMLALRAYGIGAAWTTLHLRYEKEVAELLGIPADWTQAVLLPVAYYSGDDFKAARREPATDLTYWDAWGESGS